MAEGQHGQLQRPFLDRNPAIAQDDAMPAGTATVTRVFTLVIPGDGPLRSPICRVSDHRSQRRTAKESALVCARLGAARGVDAETPHLPRGGLS